MNVRYFDNEKFTNLELLGDSDRIIFQSIADELTQAFNVQWKTKLNGFDQRYWDFEYKGITLTLHLEHYLGISILVEKPKMNNIETSKQILEEIGDHFRSWNPAG